MNATIKIICTECKELMLTSPWKHWEEKHPEKLNRIQLTATKETT
jgi:hypothetical protein